MAMPPARGGNLSLVVLIVLAALASALLCYLMVPFFQPLAFACVLAIAFQPVHQRISIWLKRPTLAALTTTLALLLAVLVPLAMLGVVVAREARLSYAVLAQHSAEQGGWQSYLSGWLDAPIAWLAARTGMAVPDLRSVAVAKAQALSEGLIEWGGSLLGNLTSVVMNGALSLFVLFFLFLEGSKMRRGIQRWLPLTHSRIDELFTAVEDSIVANVYGIAAVGITQGLLTGLGFWFTGLGAPLLWGSIAAICSLVPLVGTALIWLPGALILLAEGAWGKSLFLALWGALVVSTSDHFVRPWVLAGRTEMNTLMVFFALMGGMQAFGFLGIFAGPVIFSVAIALFRILREEIQPRLQPPPAPTEG